MTSDEFWERWDEAVDEGTVLQVSTGNGEVIVGFETVKLDDEGDPVIQNEEIVMREGVNVSLNEIVSCEML